MSVLNLLPGLSVGTDHPSATTAAMPPRKVTELYIHTRTDALARPNDNTPISRRLCVTESLTSRNNSQKAKKKIQRSMQVRWGKEND